MGKLLWDCPRKTYELPQTQRDKEVQVMERALCESVKRPGFEFEPSTDLSLDLVQLLKYLPISFIIY